MLDRIDGPGDLRGLSDEQLQQVAQEVREHIIDTVGEIGGHFGANLGTCELAVALHELAVSVAPARLSLRSMDSCRKQIHRFNGNRFVKRKN